MPTFPKCKDKSLWLDCEKFKWQNGMNEKITQDIEAIIYDSDSGDINNYTFNSDRQAFVNKLDNIYANTLEKNKNE
jgi:hypothetical protein